MKTNPKFVVTIFDSVYDRYTDKKIYGNSFDEFEAYFKRLFDESNFQKKTDAKLFSPAVYKSGTTRQNVNVEKFSSWFAADLDSFVFDPNSTEILQDQLENAFPKSIGTYRYFIYSTARSSRDKPKMRIIFELTNGINPDKITLFWYSMNEILKGSIDKQTKDHARMFYQPGQYETSDNRFFFSSPKNRPVLNPESLIADFDSEFLISKTFLKTLPDTIISEIAKLKKGRLNKQYSWTSWQDCPFVNKEKVSEYHSIVIMNTDGRYFGLYRLMVSVASIAIKKGYPITASEVETIVRDIDNSIDGFYRKRNISKEAAHAVSFAYESI
jgi:hypothetical protein